MIKSINKKIRRSAGYVFLAVIVMMMAMVGCRDSSITNKELLDPQLVNFSGGAWEIVCAGEEKQCSPENSRAIVFNADFTATLFNVAPNLEKSANNSDESSWSQFVVAGDKLIKWHTEGKSLFITYDDDCVDRYTMVVPDSPDGLLTLRAENAKCLSGSGSEFHPTAGKKIAGFKRANVPTYTVNFPPASDSGSISVVTFAGALESGTRVPAGTILTIKAEAEIGFELLPGALTVNGKPHEKGTPHTVTNTVNIAAAFTYREYAVHFTKTYANGTLSVVNATTNAAIDSGTIVRTGTPITITATPKEGYRATIIVDNIDTIKSRTITRSVQNETKIVAEFTQLPKFPVTFNTPVNGTLSVIDTLKKEPIASGDSVYGHTVLGITATPDTGYIDEITVNGEPFPNGAFHEVTGDVVIDAKFETMPTYPIKITKSPTGGTLSVTYGNITFNDGDMVTHGMILTITATPDANYSTSITLNNEPIQSGATHEVIGNVVIKAEFDIKTYPIRISQTPGGTLSVKAGSTTFNDGDTVAHATVLTITASTTIPGYELTSLIVNVSDFKSKNGETHIVLGDVEITATFDDPSKPNKSITFNANPPGGTLSVINMETDEPITSGDEVATNTPLKFIAAEKSGCVLTRLTVNGVAYGNETMLLVTGSMIIDAVFSAPVTFSAGSNGGISVTLGGTAITSGTNVIVGRVLRITASAEPGYLVNLTVNGNSFTNGGSYTVTGPVNIAATFPPMPTYPVKITTGQNGFLEVRTQSAATITSGAGVISGTLLRITAAANFGYLVNLTVNDNTFVNGGWYTVTSATSIVAEFPPVPSHAVNLPGGGGGTGGSWGQYDGGQVTITRWLTEEVVKQNEMLAEGTVVRITATTNPGYSMSEFTVNNKPFTSGDTTTVGKNGLSVGVSFVPSPSVGFSTSPPTGGMVSATTRSGRQLQNGAQVDIGEVLDITATESPGWRLETITVNDTLIPATQTGNTHTATYTVTQTDTVRIATNFVPDGKASSIVSSTPTDTSDMTPEEKVRHDEFRRRRNKGDKVEFSNVWLLMDATKETHVLYPKDGGASAKTYAASGVFRENSEFWIVGIPLKPNGEPDYSEPAKYAVAGTWKSVGGVTTINVTELQLATGSSEAYSGWPSALEFPDGSRDMTIKRENGKENQFEELRCLVLENDPGFVSVVQDMDPGKW